MLRRETYRIKNLMITADDGSYLVHVEWNSDHSGAHCVQDLPNWIFQSRYAIWLSSRDLPIRERAVEGERIKQHLLKQLAS